MKNKKPIKRRIPLPKKPPKIHPHSKTYTRKRKHPKPGADEPSSRAFLLTRFPSYVRVRTETVNTQKEVSMPSNFEIERRFLYPRIRIPAHLPGSKIVQGYFMSPDGSTTRIRCTNNQKYTFTHKIGTGKKRKETEYPIDDWKLAQMQLAACHYFVRKHRWKLDGWEINRYMGVLKGLYVLEREFSSMTKKLVFPPWVDPAQAIEVTDRVTNYDLAVLVADLQQLQNPPPLYDVLGNPIPVLVLTGAPCSGKTTMLNLLHEEFGNAFMSVPETATIVIDRLGVRFPVDQPLYVRRFQQHIYNVQSSFERLASIEAKQRGSQVILVDRGSVDNAAYLPGGMRELEHVCSTHRKREFQRYAMVMCLGVPPERVYEEHKANNPARKETYSEAVAIGERTWAAWSNHPDAHHINDEHWETKVNRVRGLMRTFLQG